MEFSGEPDGKIPVLVSIEPQRFFVEKIGGDRVRVEVLVPAGKEPETYVPTPEQLKKIGKCEVFFRIGFPAEESFLPKLKTLAPQLRIVDTRKGISLRTISAHSHHGHGAEQQSCEHGEGADPHIWLAPKLVQIQSKTILDALTEQDPEGTEFYDDHYNSFITELEELHDRIASKLEPFQGETLYVFHPTYGYFCEEYGLHQRAIEIEGRSPKAKELAQWIQRAKEDRIHAILIQPEFNPAPAEKIASEVGAKVFVHSSLGYDYFDGLDRLVEIIVDKRAEKPGPPDPP